MIGLWDIHCHILPGVDDGAASWEETRQMLLLEKENGVNNIIATPHYRRGMFEPSMDNVNSQFIKLCQEADRLDMNLYLGCEYHIDMDMVDNLSKGKRPSMAGSSYVLTEFSSADSFEKIRDGLYRLISSGWKPIIAHVERYPVVVQSLDNIRSFTEMGAYIQVNAGSILGKEGMRTKLLCRRLLKADLVHFVASDGHGMKYRRPELGKCADYVERKMGTACAKRIFLENPSKMTENHRRRT